MARRCCKRTSELKWHKDNWLNTMHEKTPTRFETNPSMRGIREAKYEVLSMEFKKTGIPMVKQTQKYFDYLDVLHVNEIPNVNEPMYSTQDNHRLFLLKSVFPELQVFIPVMVHPGDSRNMLLGQGQHGPASFATGAMFANSNFGNA